MNKFFQYFLVIGFLLLSGCASESFRVQAPAQTTPDAPTLVLLNQTSWEATIRAELAKRNFNLVKLQSADFVVKQDSKGTIARVAKESNVQYGLMFISDTVHFCPHNPARSQWIVGNIEVTDLKTNQVLFSIAFDEWTEACAFRGTDGMNQLMNLFAKTWNEKIKK